MFKKISVIGLTVCMGLFLTVNLTHAQINSATRITGPYLWMIAPTVNGQGGKDSTNVDSLAAASNNEVTEEKVARNGAKKGDKVGNYEWTEGRLPADGNINAMLVSLGIVTNNDINDITSYALLVLRSTGDQESVAMGVNSDDSIKVWLNGEVVHTKAENRGRGNANTFQDTFNIDLKNGNNLFMIKVSERTGGWGMYVGVDADYAIKDPDTVFPVEPTGKLTTQWAQIKGKR